MKRCFWRVIFISSRQCVKIYLPSRFPLPEALGWHDLAGVKSSENWLVRIIFLMPIGMGIYLNLTPPPSVRATLYLLA